MAMKRDQRLGGVTALWMALSLVAFSACSVDERDPQSATRMNLPAQGTPGVGALPGGSGGGGAGSASNAGAAAGGSGGASPAEGPPNVGGAGGAVQPTSGGSGNTGGTGSGSGGSGGTGGIGSAGTGTAAPPVVASDGGPVPVSVGTCAAFEACGGALEGVWVYQTACVDPADVGLDQLASLCPDGLPIRFADGPGATLEVTGGIITRPGEPIGPGQMLFSDACTAQFGGCEALASVFAEAFECGQVAAGCSCALEGSTDWGQNTFSVDGGQLTLADGRTFDYCVAGDVLTMRETGEVRETGTFTLTRQ
jgi:hypothetical protein